MRQPKALLLATSILTAFTAALARAATSSQPATVTVTPRVVQMGTFYGGAKVRVEGKVTPGSKVVVAVRGSDVTEFFNKVGRVGPIWINTGKVAVSGAPSLLMVFSSEPLDSCLTRAEIDQHQLDAAAIKKQIQIEPQAQGGDPIATDFLKLKVRQGSYRMVASAIETGSVEDGSLPYALEFVWPKNASPGAYEVSVYACREGEVKESLKGPLKVVEVGFPALVASMAREHASTYGIVSIVVAILAGFGIDFLATRLFKKRISAH